MNSTDLWVWTLMEKGFALCNPFVCGSFPFLYERSFPPLVLSPLFVSTIGFKCHQPLHHLPETGVRSAGEEADDTSRCKQRGKYKKAAKS